MNRKKIVTYTATLLCGVIAGIGLMQFDPVYSSVQSALGKENTHNTIGFNQKNGIFFQDLSSVDLETAMMLVQDRRQSLLDSQLKQQITAVQSRNDEIAKYNGLLAQLYNLNAYFAANANANTVLPDSAKPLLGEIHQTIAGFSVDWQQSSEWTEFVNKEQLLKSDVDNAMVRAKNIIDRLNNTQQLDMVRLQSLSNKRNEAFDVMTNFIKKMQDSRSSIIGNMR